MKQHLTVLLLALSMVVGPDAVAQLPGLGGDDRTSGEQLVPVRALADVEVVHPGQTFNLAVVFTIEPGWHIYWINAGSSGLPTSVEVKPPSGYSVGDTRYPRPKMFQGEEGTSFGYARQVVLFVPVTAPPTLPEGTAAFDLSMSWLVCKKACLLGSAKRTVTVRTASAASSPGDASPVQSKVLTTFRARLPRAFKELEGRRAQFDGQRLTMSGLLGELDRVAFFPVEMPGVEYGDQRIDVEDGRFTVQVDVRVRPQNARGKPIALRGLVTLGAQADDPSYEYVRPIETGSAGSTP